MVRILAVDPATPAGDGADYSAIEARIMGFYSPSPRESKHEAFRLVYGGSRNRHRWSWINWHISRGRLPLNPTARDLRMVSHRRPL